MNTAKANVRQNPPVIKRSQQHLPQPIHRPGGAKTLDQNMRPCRKNTWRRRCQQPPLVSDPPPKSTVPGQSATTMSIILIHYH
jgi:hypothetical protein